MSTVSLEGGERAAEMRSRTAVWPPLLALSPAGFTARKGRGCRWPVKLPESPFLDGAEEWVSWFCRHSAGRVDGTGSNSQSALRFLRSCSICKKKQNRHFIVPASRFKLLKVSILRAESGR